MSTAARGAFLRECLALAVPMIGALTELTIRNVYHQIAAEPTRFVYLAVIAAVSLLIAVFTELHSPRPPWRQIMRTGNRLLGLGTWAWIVAIRGATIGAWLSGASTVTLGGTIVCASWLTWLVLGEVRWVRVRPALLFAGTLFVVSQPVLARLTSSELVWPAPAMAGRSSNGAPVSARIPSEEGGNVLVLLLDELNAREGAGLAKVLASRGMAVSQRAIDPVADATAKVIPEIWSGRRFPNPKPCSFTAICSGGSALDFARVTASRPDIDVVGFYHPYCAMRGLRWCERLGLPLPFAEPGRWACSIKSRLGLTDAGRCMALQHEPFLQLRAATLAAVWRAPFWRDGGMLYAHLPLPHPPAARAGGTLEQDYRENLALASELLAEMVERAHAAGLQQLRVVVFSDHPLRQALWCAKPAYQARDCRPEADLEDRQVPLIVATFGEVPPDLGAVRTNAQIFDLVVPAGR